MKPVLALLVCCLVLVTGQDPDICTPSPDNPGPPLPAFPDVFQTSIEGNIQALNFTVVQHESYDFPNNNGALMSFTNGSRTRHLYNYATLEKFTVHPNGSCTTSNMSASPRNFFSYHMENGQAHIDKASHILHFGQEFNETYIGTTTVRGIPVNHWYSCTYREKYNATYKLDYYFSVPGYQTASGRDEIPVRAELVGRRRNIDRKTGQPAEGWKNIHNVYDFQNFHSAPSYHGNGHPYNKWMYEMEGVVCPGRVNTKTVPKIPDQFYVEVEIVNEKNQTVSYMKEYYNYKDKLVRFDFHPEKKTSWDLGAVQHKIIHDYNSGLRYMIAYSPENCTIAPIRNMSYDAAIDEKDHTKVHLKKGYELFHFDDKTFTYGGMTWARRIGADVWSAREVDYDLPPGSKYSTDIVYEWFFSADNWTSTTSGSTNQTQVPIRLLQKGTYTMEGGKPIQFDLLMNFFNYDASEQFLYHFDVSMCFKDPQMKKRVFFRMPALYNKLVEGEHYKFYHSVQVAMAEAAGLHPLRVTAVWHNILDDQLWVGATLLAHPDVQGDSVEMQPQKPLDDAFNEFKKLVDANAMVVRFRPDPSRGEEVYLTAMPGTVQTNQDFVDFMRKMNSTSNKYEPGAVAGIAIGTVLLGAVIGLGVGWVIWRYRLQDVPYGTQT